MAIYYRVLEAILINLFFFEFTNIDKRALEIFETAVDYTEGLTRNPGPRPKPSFYSVKI